MGYFMPARLTLRSRGKNELKEKTHTHKKKEKTIREVKKRKGEESDNFHSLTFLEEFLRIFLFP